MAENPQEQREDAAGGGSSTSGSRWHDYHTNRCWGHDYNFSPIDGGLRGTAIGWGEGIAKGDVLLLRGPGGGVSCYAVDRISYYPDPRDMWSADLRFIDLGPMSFGTLSALGNAALSRAPQAEEGDSPTSSPSSPAPDAGEGR